MSVPTLSEIESEITDIAYSMDGWDYCSEQSRLLDLARRIAVETEKEKLGMCGDKA